MRNITLLPIATAVPLAGLPMVLGMLCLSAAGQPPARRAADILGVRWNNPPKVVNPLAGHHTYHSAAMNVDVGYTIYLPPSYATTSFRYPVVYFLPGGGVDENYDAPPLLPSVDVAIRTGKLPPMLLVFVNGGQYTRYYDSLDGSIMMETTIIRELIPHIDGSYRT